MYVSEKQVVIPAEARLLAELEKACSAALPDGVHPVRFVVASTTDLQYECELGVLSGIVPASPLEIAPIFEFRKRRVHDANEFNVVLVIPTGIRAEIGGHAGDAGPVARILAEVADKLVLHPNVVNASDVNEMPQNALYVEGSVLSRLMMGTVGLEPVRANRVLVVIDAHEDALFVNAAVNAVSGARALFKAFSLSD